MAGLKVWGARLFTAVAIATIICQGVYVINPMADGKKHAVSSLTIINY